MLSSEGRCFGNKKKKKKKEQKQQNGESKEEKEVEEGKEEDEKEDKDEEKGEEEEKTQNGKKKKKRKKEALPRPQPPETWSPWRLNETFDALASNIRRISKSLPLDVTAVTCISPAIRGAEVRSWDFEIACYLCFLVFKRHCLLILVASFLVSPSKLARRNHH